MNEGHGVMSARSKEAARIAGARRRASTAATIGAVAGVGVAIFSPQLIKAGALALSTNRQFGHVAHTLSSHMNDPSVQMMTRIGMGVLTPKLFSKIATSGTMRAHGYSGSKYRGAT